jgi:cell division protein FtsB
MEKMNLKTGNSFIISLGIILGLGAISLLLYTFVSEVYDTYRINQDLANLKLGNERIAQENKELNLELSYIESEQSSDKWAKEKQSKINPDEELIILSSAPDEIFEEEQRLTAQERLKEVFKTTPRPEQWKNFFFDQERVPLLEIILISLIAISFFVGRQIWFDRLIQNE